MKHTISELADLTYKQHAKLTEVRHYALELMKELQQRKAEQLSKYVCYTEKGKQEIAIVSIDEVLGVEPHGK